MHGWAFEAFQFCCHLIITSDSEAAFPPTLWPRTLDLFHPFESTGTEDKNLLNKTALAVHLQLIWPTKTMIWASITFVTFPKTLSQVPLQTGCYTKAIQGSFCTIEDRTKQCQLQSSPIILLLLHLFLSGFGLPGIHLDTDEKCNSVFFSEAQSIPIVHLVEIRRLRHNWFYFMGCSTTSIFKKNSAIMNIQYKMSLHWGKCQTPRDKFRSKQLQMHYSAS